MQSYAPLRFRAIGRRIYFRHNVYKAPMKYFIYTILAMFVLIVGTNPVLAQPSNNSAKLQEQCKELENKFGERWNSLSLTEKARFCEMAETKCASGNYAAMCDLHKTHCFEPNE